MLAGVIYRPVGLSERPATPGGGRVAGDASDVIGHAVVARSQPASPVGRAGGLAGSRVRSIRRGRHDMISRVRLSLGGRDGPGDNLMRTGVTPRVTNRQHRRPA